MIKGALANGDEVKVLLGVSRFPEAVNYYYRAGEFEEMEFNPFCEKLFGTELDLVPCMFGDMTEFWSHRVLQLELNTGRRMVPRKSFGG